MNKLNASKSLAPHLPRRRVLAAMGSSALLAACGGGGGGAGDTPAPVPPGDSFTVLTTRFTALQHSATLADDGSVILVGGSRGQSTVSDAVDRFDPALATGALTRIGTLAAGRSNHRATRLADGRIMIVGGERSSGDPRVVEMINERTGEVSQTGSMSVSRQYHAVLTLPDGRVLVSGGTSNGEFLPLGISDSMEMWEPSTGRFRRLDQRMSVGRSSHSMTLMPDGRVLIVGGYSASSTYVFSEVFDPASERLTAVPFAQPVRASHAAHLDSQGSVLVLGGEGVGSDNSAVPFDSVLQFDPLLPGWRALKSLNIARTWAASVRMAGGQILLFGGQTSANRYASTCERYDTANGGAAMASLDGERALHTATLLKTGKVLVAGGETTGGALVSTMLMYQF